MGICQGEMDFGDVKAFLSVPPGAGSGDLGLNSAIFKGFSERQIDRRPCRSAGILLGVALIYARVYIHSSVNIGLSVNVGSGAGRWSAGTVGGIWLTWPWMSLGARAAGRFRLGYSSKVLVVRGYRTPLRGSVVCSVGGLPRWV